MSARLPPVLLIEDSLEDFEATRRAFTKAKLDRPLRHVRDGEEALDYLRRRGRFEDPADAPRPCLILLDLNLPGMDGQQVLRECKADPDLRQIPIVILTTSTGDRDIEACYRDGANSYVQKPVDLDRFVTVIQRLREYWFESVILPRGDGQGGVE